MQVLKPFSKVEDLSKQKAANEATPIEIPFQHPDYLGPQYSNGKTDRCFMLRSKANNEIYPWNQVMAEFGNVHYMPHFDLDLLYTPEFESSVKVWIMQGVLPKDFLKAKPASAPKPSTGILRAVEPDEEAEEVAPVEAARPGRKKLGATRDLASAFGATNDTPAMAD